MCNRLWGQSMEHCQIWETPALIVTSSLIITSFSNRCNHFPGFYDDHFHAFSQEFFFYLWLSFSQYTNCKIYPWTTFIFHYNVIFHCTNRKCSCRWIYSCSCELSCLLCTCTQISLGWCLSYLRAHFHHQRVHRWQGPYPQCLIQWNWGRIKEFIFLTSSQVVLNCR